MARWNRKPAVRERCARQGSKPGEIIEVDCKTGADIGPWQYGLKGAIAESFVQHSSGVSLRESAGGAVSILDGETGETLKTISESERVQTTAENRFADIYHTDPDRARAMAREFHKPGERGMGTTTKFLSDDLADD